MKVLCALSPTATLDFMTKSQATQSTNINIALTSLLQYMCVHTPVCGHVQVYTNMHCVRRADSTQVREKFKWFRFVF